MNDPKSQPGQRNIASQGDRNINASGDNPTFNFFNTPPERSAKHQLRAPVGDFVGRETEIAELTAELTNGGQVGISGISGMGGIGKTELALVVANRLLPNYPDAQLLVELRGTDPTPRRAEDALADCVRAFVGVEARLPDDLATLTKMYRDCLTGQRVLVLLDNAADADQIRPFLVPSGCALLVTSRETISLPKMKRIRLEQLPPDKARELLREIAPRVSESVADQICYLSGYLPLAVRAAASLLDVTPDLDPAEYAAELGDERRRLELKYANAEGHEISVEASFNLSYARLSPESARVFRSLSVFPASFDATAEEAICQDAGHKCLSELLRRNLVIFDETERRYRLHDLARVFANAQLSDDEREDLEMNHARHFCDVLENVGNLYEKGHDQILASLVLYDSDRTNIEAGMAWAMSQLEVSQQAAELCAGYLSTGVNVLDLRLHPREHIQWIEKAILATRKLRWQRYEAALLGNLGAAYGDLGEPLKSISLYMQSLAIKRECGDRHGESITLGNLGNAYAELGETCKAIEFYEQALTLHRKIGFRRGEGDVLNNLGSAYEDLGNIHKAIELYEQSLAVKREIGDRRGEGYSLGSLGNAYFNLGEIQKAIEFLEQALKISDEVNDRRSEGICQLNLGQAVNTLGDRTRAIAHAEAALKLFEEVESSHTALVRDLLAEWRSEMMKSEG